MRLVFRSCSLRQRGRQVLWADIVLNRRVGFGGRDCKKRQLFKKGGPVKVIEIIRTPQIALNRPPLAAAAQPDSEQFRSSPRTSRLLWRMIVRSPNRSRQQSAEAVADMEGQS